MPLEIERKFLVTNDNWRAAVSDSFELRQGYLNLEPARTVRVRIKREKGKLTIKGKSVGIVRPEFEYDIPKDDALAMLTLCEGKIIHKTRHLVHYGELVWEVDVFHGDHSGLVLAEVELESSAQTVNLPDWVGEEVSTNHRFFNSFLAAN
ncbi:adenylate cyclase [Lewinellaceae bacterium SD302]|nr:adenylate cyclase [Lewinellaceae bacterium SD302]